MLAWTSAHRDRLGLRYEHWQAVHLKVTAAVFAGGFLHVMWVDAYISALLAVGARNTLARFRAEHARRIGDPEFTALIDALELESAMFRELWPEHEVLTGQLGTKTIEHPELGTLRLRHVQSDLRRGVA